MQRALFCGREALLLIVLSLFCGAVGGLGAESLQTQWLLVTAPVFRPALAPLIEYRRAEGFKVVVIETTNVLTPEQICRGEALPLRDRLRESVRQRSGPTCMLLAGDFAAKDTATAQATVVPALLGSIGRMTNKLSDYPYCVPDKDGKPTIAVGRFPARSVSEMQGMVQKTLELEQNRQPGDWQHRMVFLGGNPGGGPLAEMFMESILAPKLAQFHPAWTIQAIVHMPSSRFYVPTDRLHDAALQTLEPGELFSFYLGHSSAPGLWSINTNFLTRADWARVKIPTGRGVFFTCGCFACQLSGRDGEGYGIAAMRNPDGPAAVIGATAESYSAPGQLAVEGLLECCAKPPFPTRLADYWLAVQSGLASGPMDSQTFALYDQFDGTSGKVPLSVQRLEHLQMWMLLGDPAMRLPVPALTIPLEIANTVIPGKSVTIQGTLPEPFRGGKVKVTLERPIGSKPAGLQRLPSGFESNRAERERIAYENWKHANQTVLAVANSKAAGTNFSCQLEIPASLSSSNLIFRAWAASGKNSALGLATVPVN